MQQELGQQRGKLSRGREKAGRREMWLAASWFRSAQRTNESEDGEDSCLRHLSASALKLLLHLHTSVDPDEVINHNHHQLIHLNFTVVFRKESKWQKSYSYKKNLQQISRLSPVRMSPLKMKFNKIFSHLISTIWPQEAALDKRKI